MGNLSQKEMQKEKNPSALPNSLAFAITKSDFSSAMRGSVLGQSPWNHSFFLEQLTPNTQDMLWKRVAHPALSPEAVLPPHLLAKDFEIWGEKKLVLKGKAYF